MSIVIISIFLAALIVIVYALVRDPLFVNVYSEKKAKCTKKKKNVPLPDDDVSDDVSSRPCPIPSCPPCPECPPCPQANCPPCTSANISKEVTEDGVPAFEDAIPASEAGEWYPVKSSMCKM